MFLFFANLVYADAPAPRHYPILKFEKNENPENILVVYTVLDEECHFRTDSKKSNIPVLDFYWLMNGNKYKPTHPLIKYNIRKKLQIDPQYKFSKDSDSFPILLNDLTVINSEFKNSRLVVHTKKSAGKCSVSASLDSNDKELAGFSINRIYSESKKTIFPPFRKVVSIRIDGIDPFSQKKKFKIYQAK